MDVWSAVRVTELLAAGGVVVSSLETLARHEVSVPGGWNAWDIARGRVSWAGSGVLGAVLDGVLRYRRERLLIVVRAVVAVVLVVVPLPYGWHVAGLWCVTVCLLLRNLRTPFHGVGSDQMLLVVYGSLAVAFASGAVRVGLWAIAGHVCMAYVVSGLYKVWSGAWRDGTALTGVLMTITWGHSGVGRVLAARPLVARVVSWAVIGGESAFPGVLAVPGAVLPWVLGASAVFHGCAAVVMGLNGFLWAFVACYPSLFYVAGVW